MRALVALALVLAGCPEDVVFQGGDASQTSVTDTSVSDTSAPEDTTSEVFDETCDFSCVDDMSVGACGTDLCGLTCHCPSAIACNGDGLCAPAVDYETAVTTALPSPLASWVDALGRPRVLRLEPVGGDRADVVREAFDGTTWDPEPLVLAVEEADEPGLGAALDTFGELHILASVGRGEDARTRWIHDGATGWDVDPFFGETTCLGARIERDEGGVLYGGCTDRATQTFKLARLDDVATPNPMWSTESTEDDVGEWPVAWTIDAGPRPRMAFLCCGAGAELDLVYQEWSGAQWLADEPVPVTINGSVTARAIALGVDHAGRPHIVHQAADGDFVVLVHRWRDVDLWMSEELDRAPVADSELGAVLALHTDHRRHLHLVYQDDAKLTYRAWDGFDWSSEQASPQNFALGGSAHVTADPSGTAHVVYTTATGQIRWWTPAEP